MSDAPELKPCPFCGSDHIAQEYGIGDEPYMSCVDCGANVEGKAGAWNTRADLHRAEVEAAVKRAIDACASVAFDEVMYGACPHRTQRKVLDILLDPAALERIINGGGE